MTLPLVRYLRKNTESGADIFTALGIVGGTGVECSGPVLLAALQEFVEHLSRHRLRRPWITAHFIQGKQRMIYIQRRIFEAFGQDWSRELLPAHHESKSCFPLFG